MITIVHVACTLKYEISTLNGWEEGGGGGNGIKRSAVKINFSRIKRKFTYYYNVVAELRHDFNFAHVK